MPSYSHSTDGYSHAQERLHWAVLALLARQYLVFGGIAQAFGHGMNAGVLPYPPVVKQGA